MFLYVDADAIHNGFHHRHRLYDTAAQRVFKTTDIVLCAVAGVMIVLCFTELIPETLENVPAQVPACGDFFHGI